MSSLFTWGWRHESNVRTVVLNKNSMIDNVQKVTVVKINQLHIINLSRKQIHQWTHISCITAIIRKAVWLIHSSWKILTFTCAVQTYRKYCNTMKIYQNININILKVVFLHSFHRASYTTCLIDFIYFQMVLSVNNMWSLLKLLASFLQMYSKVTWYVSDCKSHKI
jgi:hypothetical protein